MTRFTYSAAKVWPGEWGVIRLYDDNTYTLVGGLRFRSPGEAVDKAAEMNVELAAIDEGDDDDA